MGRQPIRDELNMHPTERKVAELIYKGLSQKEAEVQGNLSRSTVVAALRRLYARLGIHSRRELILLLAKHKGSIK